MARNLLKNPSGDEQLEFWELTENGGNQWTVEDMPGDCGHDFSSDGVSKYFATSFELCLKRQVIDLLAEGYSCEQLDAQPAITVEDWYCGRTDCGCTYQMTVCLLDENQEVMQEFKPEPVILDPDNDDCSWRQIGNTFSEYGPGLRFISFEHGGQDTKFWNGWFGVRVTGSSVTVDV
ncbi:F-box only protein 2 [Paralichthys olivaceus]|uniref:F-box only protein 2 n=1 Tax=Paralichthys olivaceus TaxID=8255 RepID=UPI00097D0280|nr:PREDICTED: F-box only protein 2 isoform X2 [Paralichthys olivaceus]